MAIKQPPNADVLTKDGQFNQSWIRYWQATQGTTQLAGSKVIKDWSALDASYPASGFATLDTRNARPVLDFDTSSDEVVFFHGFIPDTYTDEDIELILHLFADTATSGTANFASRIERLTGLDLDSTNYGDFAAAVETVPSNAGQLFTMTHTFSTAGQKNSLVANDPFRLWLQRDVSADNASGDVCLYMAQMRFVT